MWEAEEGSAEAALMGQLADGSKFEGVDSICLVPWSHERRKTRGHAFDLQIIVLYGKAATAYLEPALDILNDHSI